MTKARRVHSTPRTRSSKIQGPNVVRISDFRPPKPKREKQKSVYELYPLPFLNRKQGCFWDVNTTGSYTADCDLGESLAIQLLKTCDGSNGWAAFVRWIVLDMIQAGTDADGRPKAKGIVVGFMGVIGRTLAACVIQPPEGAA